MTRTPSVQRAVARPLGRQKCHCTSVRSSDEPMSLRRCSEPKSHWRSASERHVHSVTNSHATTSLWGVVGPRKHLTQSRGGQIRLTGDRAQRAEPTGDPLLPKPMTGARWRWWAPESALLPFPCVRQRRWTRVGAGTGAWRTYLRFPGDQSLRRGCGYGTVDNQVWPLKMPTISYTFLWRLARIAKNRFTSS
jgi:hypothetical protein